MRLAFLGGLMLLAASACGFAGPAGGPDGGVNFDADGSDVGAKTDASPTLAFVPNLVFVNGLVSGQATSTSDAGLPLSDVRVCIYDVGNSTYITQHAAPFSTPMPLANYPGIRKGSGVDLGSVSVAVRLDIYWANDLITDTAWTPVANLACSKIGCDQNAACKAHVSFPLTLDGDVNVVALVDDTGDGGVGVTVAKASFEYTKYAGDPGTLSGTVIDFSAWHTGDTIGAFYGNWQTGAGSDSQIANPLGKNTGQPSTFTHSILSYETEGIRFDQFSGAQPFDRFGQSLDSIAYVANAAVSPPVFYDVRQNFVFALIGDPNDPSSVLANGGRDPTFQRTGLHIAAIPYAQPNPL